MGSTNLQHLGVLGPPWPKESAQRDGLVHDTHTAMYTKCLWFNARTIQATPQKIIGSVEVTTIPFIQLDPLPAFRLETVLPALGPVLVPVLPNQS